MYVQLGLKPELITFGNNTSELLTVSIATDDNKINILLAVGKLDPSSRYLLIGDG